MRSTDAELQDEAKAATPLPPKGPNDVPPPPTDDALTRRTALKMLSATALLTAAGCTRKPKRHVVAVTDRPEYMRPGMPLHYATTWTDGSYPYGLLVKTIDGRPVKIEGLPEHPLSRGRSTAQMQSSILSLYDPERLRNPKQGDQDLSWESADKAIVAALRRAKSAVLVTRGLLGPSERKLIERFGSAVQGLQHFVYEPADDSARRIAWKACYGEDGLLVPDFEQAKVILSIDADFLGTDGDVLSAARGFAANREAGKTLSRLYVAESAMTVTGTAADHRVPLRPAAMRDFAQALHKAIKGDAAALGALAGKSGLRRDVLEALASDLKAAGKNALVVAGPHLPPSVHAATALINDALGAAGTTLRWNPTPATVPASDHAEIAKALSAGPDVAILMGVNPVHDWAGGGFDELLANAKVSIGHALTENETLAACTYSLPSCHNLESWNDAQVAPGLTSFCQPMIAPLFDGRQEAESLLVWLKAMQPNAMEKGVEDFHDVVRLSWAGKTPWPEALRAGMAGSAGYPAPPKPGDGAGALAGVTTPAAGADSVDIVFLPDNSTGDGRFAGSVWLQEQSDPVSKLVWDNAASIAPSTAKSLGVKKGHWITLVSGSASLDLPVLVQPGVAAGAVIVTIGYGRTHGAGAGNGVGVNVAPLQTGGRVSFGASASKSGREWYQLVQTQGSFDQAPGGVPRPLALSATVGELAEDSKAIDKQRHIPKKAEDGLPIQIDPSVDYSNGNKWGMAIDLGACTACGACTIACQSENNIQVVGKEECGNRRDMAWIRLDRYEAFAEDDADHQHPIVDHQPMLCQHCDNAPCETVCPVNATAHSPDGLNEQIYNRCVGTRYCLNNCPYKVRRFNFYNYTRRNIKSPEQELANNPHVTVRMRGVMEKCTFCVQRIKDVTHKAANAAPSTQDAVIPDGSIKTACMQACPSNAIVFGDLNDTSSRVAKARESNLAYHVLEELNVRPNVTYLAKVRNPNPKVAPPKLETHGGGH